MKKKGFTLAEVLVTLGIIGVVSALTVPTLMKNHQKKVFVTQFRKAYSELSQAVENYTDMNNSVNLYEAGLNGDDGVMDFVSKEFKTVQMCNDTSTPCFASSYKTLSGTALNTSVFDPNGKKDSCFLSAGGYSMCLNYVNSNIIHIYIDVNSVSGPNIAGRDFYSFSLSPKKNLIDGNNVILSMALSDMMGQSFDTSKIPSLREFAAQSCISGGMGCFEKLLENNWEMDY